MSLSPKRGAIGPRAYRRARIGGVLRGYVKLTAGRGVSGTTIAGGLARNAVPAKSAAGRSRQARRRHGGLITQAVE